MIPAVVLAAGLSSRMGRPKATLTLETGETFLERIVRVFQEAGTDDVFVVVGHAAEEIAERFAPSGLAARFVVNRDFERGQLSSLLVGLAAVDRPGVRAALVTLVDAPLVSVDTVRAVMDRYTSTKAPIVRPVSADGVRHGHPVLIDRSLFAALRSADPATGAKPVVRAHVSPEGDVITNDEGAFGDIDTPDDYRAAVGSETVSRKP